MRIMTVLPLAAAILFSSPAFARDDRPVSCIYNRASVVKRPDLVALVRSNFKPANSGEKMAMLTIGEGLTACRVKYGWSPQKQNFALNFLRARVLREDAVSRGTKYGLTDEMLTGLVGTLDAAGRAAWLGGQPTAALSGAAFTYLKGAGLVTDSLPADDSAVLNQAIAEGITGILAQQDAETSYAA